MASLIYTAEKANFSKTYDIIQKSNIANFIEIMKPEELVSSIITTRLDDAKDKLQRNSEKEFDYNSQFLKEKNNAALNEMINIIQSVSTRGFTTYEIFEDINNKVYEDLLLTTGSYKDYTFNDFVDNSNKIKDKSQEEYTLSNFINKSIKIVSTSKISETFKDAASHIMISKTDDKYGINQVKSGSFDFNNYFYSIEEMINSEDVKSNINIDIKNSQKSKPSVSAILVENPYIRVGTRNSLELSYFFNGLTNVEMSKAYPHFNIAIKLPSIVANKDTVIYRTATLNNHLFGKVNSADKTDVFELFEQNIENVDADIKKGNNTNFSIFTQPQTLVNMDEPNDRNRDYKNRDRRFANVQDKTLPFLAIKSLNIDVIPSTNFVSFNSGKLTIICFDRTRMSDITPFIKPEMYGAFGAEIIIEYGWNHIDKYNENKNKNNRNLIGEFINESKRKEVYSIQSSSFTINEAGVVTIDLVIALKGPVEFRNQEITGNSTEKIRTTNILQKLKLLKDLKTKCFKGFNFIDKFEDALNITIETSKSGLIDERYSSAIASMINIYDILPDTEEFFGKTINEQNEIDYASITNAFHQVDTKKSTSEIKDFASQSADELKKIKFMFNKAFLNRQITNTISKEDSYTIKDSIVNAFAFSDSKKNNLETKIFNGLELKYFLSCCELVRELSNDLKSILSYMSQRQKNAKEFENRLINSMTSGYDPFWNKIFVADLNANYQGANINNNKYISFGCLLSSLVSVYMGTSMKYDDIQLVFYNTNEYAGMLSRKNIASILIDKDKLKELLKDIYEKNQLMTLEGLITHIIRTQIQEKNHIGYGFSDIFDTFIKDTENKTDTKSEQESLEQQIEERLKKIYWGDAGPNIASEDALKFLLPSLHCSFDTISSDNNDKTILRLSIYDRNDSPYSAMIDIFRKSLNSNFINDITKLNLLRRQTSSSDEQFHNAVKDTLKRLIKNGIIAKDEKGNWFIKPDKNSTDVKKILKKALPSITFANETSTILSANITAAGDGKLPSVFLLRPERNNLANLNKFRLNVPIKIIPTSLQVEMLGCPWINFGQAIFFDFETETSLDNIYMITGIKHSIEPGVFKTSLTASFTESFGSYELSSIQLSEFISQAKISIDAEQAETSSQTKDTLTFNDESTNSTLTKIPNIDTPLKATIELKQLKNIIENIHPTKEVINNIKREPEFNLYIKLVENMNKGFMSLINSNNLYLNCEANRKYDFLISSYIKKFFGSNKYTITADNTTKEQIENYLIKNFNNLSLEKRKILSKSLKSIYAFNDLKNKDKIKEEECIHYIKFLEKNIPIYKKFERIIDYNLSIEFTPILGASTKNLQINKFTETAGLDIFISYPYNQEDYKTTQKQIKKYRKIFEEEDSFTIDNSSPSVGGIDTIEIDIKISLYHAYIVNQKEDFYYICIDTDYEDFDYEVEEQLKENYINNLSITINSLKNLEKSETSITRLSKLENIIDTEEDDDIISISKNNNTKFIYKIKNNLADTLEIINSDIKSASQQTATINQQVTQTLTSEQIAENYLQDTARAAGELADSLSSQNTAINTSVITPIEVMASDDDLTERQETPQVSRLNGSDSTKSIPNIRLTGNFSINEFEKRSKIPDEFIANVKQLATELEKIRALLNKSLIIISGYRDKEYNASVGGKDKSFHLQAKAADFYIRPDADKSVYATLTEAAIKIINAKNITGCIILYDEFIHYDTRNIKRKQLLVINASSQNLSIKEKTITKNNSFIVIRDK